MWQAIVNSSFIQTCIHGITVLITTMVMLALIGLTSFACGELFPRRFVHYDRFPFKQFKWEQNGKLYVKLKVNLWKDKVPDMSTFFKGMFYKKAIGEIRTAAYFERFVKETCVAEVVHIALMLAGFIVFYNYHDAWGLCASILFALGNIPFVLIQRYNRPRFLTIMERQRKAEQKKAAQAAQEVSA